MDWFKCLFCLKEIKDRDLICEASCDHLIHEWCVGTMKSIEDRRCKLCERDTIVQSIFKEFDMERAVQIAGVPLMIKKLDEIVEHLKTRDEETTELKNNFKKISDKLENLQVEHRALKFENRETEQRLRKMEAVKVAGSNDKREQ